MKQSRRIFAESLVVAAALTVFTYAVGYYMAWFTEPRWLEIAAVFTSYSCTYMCNFQTRWNYPMGFLSSILYVVLFYQDKYYGSAFVTAYLLFAITYGYWRWGPDGKTKRVEFVGLSPWWIGYAALVAAFYFSGMYILENVLPQFLPPDADATLPAFDAYIFAGTILAQFLLDNKKIETWAVWATINVAAIYTYSESLPLVAFQYLFFLANTVWAGYNWHRSMQDSRPAMAFGRTA